MLRPDTVRHYGDFFARLAGAVTPGGSELGLGVTLFSLVVAIRAARCIEIGRWNGFSGLAIAGGLRLLDDPGWAEPGDFFDRPGFDFARHLGRRTRTLYSYDPDPRAEAESLWSDAGVRGWIRRLDLSSQDPKALDPLGVDAFDLVFVDGDHSYRGVLSDVRRYWPLLRSGGYMVLHDFFGWYQPNGKNGSPVRQVADQPLEIPGPPFELHQSILIDTGFPSFVIFRKASDDDGIPT